MTFVPTHYTRTAWTFYERRPDGALDQTTGRTPCSGEAVEILDTQYGRHFIQRADGLVAWCDPSLLVKQRPW